MDSRDLLQFRRNRAAKELLRRIQAQIYDLGQRALDKDVETYEERKGRAKGLKWVLEQLDDISVGTEEPEAEVNEDEEIPE